MRERMMNEREDDEMRGNREDGNWVYEHERVCRYVSIL